MRRDDRVGDRVSYQAFFERPQISTAVMFVVVQIPTWSPTGMSEPP
jgi:hypothetical protein